MKVITISIDNTLLSFEWLGWGEGANDPMGEGFLTFLSRSDKGDSIISYRKKDIKAMQLLVPNDLVANATPYDLSSYEDEEEEETPNSETVEALEASRKGDVIRASSVEDLFNDEVPF